MVEECDGVNAEWVCVVACELEEPALDSRLAPAWLFEVGWRCAPSVARLLPVDLLPLERTPFDDSKRAPEPGCAPDGEREARTPPDRAPRGALDVAGPATPGPGSAAGTEVPAREPCVEGVFGVPIEPPPFSRQIPPG